MAGWPLGGLTTAPIGRSAGATVEEAGNRQMCALNDEPDNAWTPNAGTGQSAVFAIAARGKP